MTFKQFKNRIRAVFLYWPATAVLRCCPCNKYTAWLRNWALTTHTLGLSLRPLLTGKEWDDVYLWRMFGYPLKRLPETVLIGSIQHVVQHSDGLVVFSQKSGFYGHHSRICFERDSDGMLWYLKFSETWDQIPVAHVQKAFAIVEAVFGGDFAQKKQGK